MNIEIKKSIKPVNYFDAINVLESRLKDLYENNDQELIWTLEHNEVFTAGTSYKENEIIDKSIKILETNRGGKITYHGPGQLVCYPILDLENFYRDIHKYLRDLEDVVINTLEYFNISASRNSKETGVWLDVGKPKERKICALGIKVSRWGYNARVSIKCKYKFILLQWHCSMRNK